MCKIREMRRKLRLILLSRPLFYIWGTVVARRIIYFLKFHADKNNLSEPEREKWNIWRFIGSPTVLKEEEFSQVCVYTLREVRSIIFKWIRTKIFLLISQSPKLQLEKISSFRVTSLLYLLLNYLLTLNYKIIVPTIFWLQVFNEYFIVYINIEHGKLGERDIKTNFFVLSFMECDEWKLNISFQSITPLIIREFVRFLIYFFKFWKNCSIKFLECISTPIQ